MQLLRLRPTFQIYLLLTIAIVIAIVPFSRVLANLYDVWNLKPEYSHGIIIPFLSAFLIWRQRGELQRLPFVGSWLGLLVIAAGFALGVVGKLTTMQTFEHYAFLLVLYGLVLALTGPAVFRRLWVPLLILVFALPLPSIFDNALSLKLQLLSSVIGMWVIRAAGITVLLEGNVIDLGSYQLEVAEACSGLRYLYPLMTLAFLIVYMLRGPIWKRLLIFFCAIPITVLMNSLRIGFIGITVEYWGPQMAQGVLHEFEGWLVFMLSTGALVLTAFAVMRVGNPGVSWQQTFMRPPLNNGPVRTAETATASVGQTIPRQFLTAAVLVLIGALTQAAVPQPRQIIVPRTDFSQFPTRLDDWVGRRNVLEKVYLDALALDDYMLTDYSNSLGHTVNVYVAYYQTQDTSRHVHSPHDCIPGGGWEIQKFEQRPFPGAQTGETFAANRAVIQLGSNRAIVYYWFQVRGRRFTNEYVMKWYLFWDAMTRHRTDGALVRLVAPFPAGANESDIDSRIEKLGTLVEGQLAHYVPN